MLAQGSRLYQNKGMHKAKQILSPIIVKPIVKGFTKCVRTCSNFILFFQGRYPPDIMGNNFFIF
jgi:hypothetical protein